MTAEMFAKERASIRAFGFVDPITVRPHPLTTNAFQIIDGEQRFSAGQAEGMSVFPCVVLDVDDVTAQQLTIVLNETRGQADSRKLADLVKGLSERLDQSRLRDVLPFSAESLNGMLGGQVLDFSSLETQRMQREQFVERVFRMPRDAAEVLDQAIAKAQAEGVEQAWQALEMIAAEYMSS